MRKIKKKHVIGATRISSRVPRDGVPIATKAINRAKERDNITGTKSHNSFSVLNSTRIALQTVMFDLDIDYDESEEQIGAFRVEELARATIAKAQYKVYLETLKQHTAPPTEDDLVDYSLGVISNQHRNIDTDFPRGDDSITNEFEEEGGLEQGIS